MHKQFHLIVKWTALFSLICLCGCASPTALKSDYADYSDVYAKSSNEQLLKNLARLANDDPAYFIQLGTINSQYTFSTMGGFMPSYTKNAPAGAMASGIEHTLMFGGSLSAGLTQNPQFQFLPIAGSNLVEAMLNPITDKVLYTFYDQGYPAELVARTMVASVQHATTTKSDTGIVTNYEYWINNPNDPTYPRFLDFCSTLHYDQRWQVLTVGTGATTTNLVYCGTNSKLPDIVASVQAGLSVKFDTNSDNTVVTQIQPGSFKFVVNNPPDVDFYMKRKALIGLEKFSPASLSELDHKVTGDTQDPETSLSSAVGTAQDFAADHFVLKMRTFEAAMYSVAKEEGYFRRFAEGAQHPPPYPDVAYMIDADGPCAKVTRSNNSTFKVRPIMTLTCPNDPIEKAPPSNLVVHYGDKTYFVGDPTNSTQNKTVFTILTYLYSQTAISTQNLPVQQLIQVQ
jgi:hypothetical protein